MPKLNIPKLDFYAFQFTVTIKKQTERQGVREFTTVYRDFEFVEPLLTHLNFYYGDPRRIIYYVLKTFTKPRETFSFRDSVVNDLDFHLTLWPMPSAKLPHNRDHMFLLIKTLEDMLEEFMQYSSEFSFTRKQGDCISTLGGYN